MKMSKWWIVPGVLAASAALSGASVAASSATDDEFLSGERRDRAVASALEFTGEGEALEAEVGDGGAAFEVEIKLDNGSVTEVELDSDFAVVGGAADGDGDDSHEGEESD